MISRNYIPQPKNQGVRGISLKVQLKMIKEKFPHVQVLKQKGNSFIITLKIRPTYLSKDYNIKIHFDRNDGVIVYVIDEILRVAKNRTRLPHVYSHKEQRLCLYSPSRREWSNNKLIVSTIIPWTSDWLFYYELWVESGQWFGGGHDEYRETDDIK